MSTNEQKKAQHTPGPWQANGLAIAAKRSYNTEFYGRLRNFSNPIADVFGDPMQDEAELEDCVDGTGRLTGVSFRVPGCNEAQANARLIAAAPELLEALENAVISNFGRKGILEPENLPGWARLACRVIAKATGEDNQ